MAGAQANRVGIRLTPNQLFDHQTIASLAQAAKPTATAEQPLASHQSGPVPLNAIQHWFFAQDFAQPGVFNHQVTLSLPHHVDRATIETRLQRLINRHDAFRLIFQNGEQSLIESAPKISLRSLPDVESASTALNQPFLLEQAPLFRAALVGPSTLILVAHHLIVDGVSWAILLDELLHPDAPSLPPIGFGTWCHHLDQAAANGAFRDEIAYWKAHDTHNPTGLPLDTSAGSPAENLEASRAVITSTIPAASLAKAPAPIQEILITSVASAISAWTQQPHVRMDIEGHGRETALIDLDISTSLGWFTSLYPLTIPVHPRATPKARLATVSERMHSLPRHGAAYGILTQSDTKSGLTPCASEILFNYLGHVDGEPIRLIRHPDNQRSYLLEIDAIISRGNLEINWHYSDRLHAHATVQRLADDSLACLQAIVSEGDKPTASTIDTKTMSKLANLLEKIDTAT